MPRRGPSRADREVTAALAERDLRCSPAQLERWRHVGLLPTNTRRGAGRGSASTLEPETVEIAAALARHARQGRDLRLAVLDWFAEAGLPQPGRPPVPEPPPAAVHAALEWMSATCPIRRLIGQARQARTEPDIDAFYRMASNAFDNEPIAPIAFDVADMRAAILARRELEEDAPSRSSGRQAVVQLIAAAGLGIEEIGVDAFIEALATLYPALPLKDLQGVLSDEAFSGEMDALLKQFARFDGPPAIQSAGIDELRQARTVLYQLSGVAAFYRGYALLMPDTAGLAALRARVDELGAGHLLMMVSGWSMTRRTRDFAAGLDGCMQPWAVRLSDELMKQMRDGPPLLGGPDDAHTAETFMEDWVAMFKTRIPAE
ncbi:hypothetical protein ETD86_11545 [Nonomuraea turkmeniaca]|uniref:Uncharacterized protein n=1 Tax=Nonomuraea turkmeniaca TaxID=103838 RepID=A0A5S4FPX2_9ACTN|nr:hypothetical protein [Nonomuraea turkmeniaca]TMR22474.1 hypothetical protein ETD86_11545 [Nonomuraea turkmeniaca]